MHITKRNSQYRPLLLGAAKKRKDLRMKLYIYTLRRCFDPGFGPREEKEAINGARTLTSWDLYITADGDLHSYK